MLNCKSLADFQIRSERTEIILSERIRRAGFSLLSPIYDHCAKLVFGKKFYRDQAENLRRIPKHASVLVIGAGSGELLTALEKSIVPSSIDILDFSKGMLRKQAKRTQSLHNVYHLDIRHTLPDIQYDLVLIPFVLNCLEDWEIADLLERLPAILKTGGRVSLSDFDHLASKDIWWLPSLYTLFRPLISRSQRTIPDWDKLLAASPFEDVQYIAQGKVATFLLEAISKTSS